MNIVTRILALGALGAASLTQGCGCSSNNNSTNTVVEPPPGETPTVSISGAAVKGVVGGGVVSAFTLDNKGVVSAQPFTTAVTDALGKYTIKIPETYIGKPISFRISPASNDTTKLTCDLDIGCGGTVKFGDKFTLPTNSKLVLETIVPALDKTKNVNLSTFSTIAAEKARSALAGNADAKALAEAIRKANGEIANIFGLLGDLTEIELIDITDKDAVKAAVDGKKLDILRIAALNAAVISASQSANPGASLEQALAKLVADISGKGLASNSSDASVADLTKILTAVSNILEQVKKLNANGVDLTELITSVANDLGRVRNEPVDVYNTGVVLSDDTLDAKAKAFADIVRRLSNGGDVVLKTSVKDGTVGTGLDKLSAQWDAAQMLSGKDVEALGNSLSVAAEAVAEADNAYGSDDKLTSYMAGEVKVDIKKVEQKIVYTVDQAISGNAVKLEASSQRTETTLDKVESVMGKLALTGSASNSAVKISLVNPLNKPETRHSSLETTKLTRETKNNIETIVVEGMKLVLVGEVAQVESANLKDPVTANGTLSLNFANFERTKGASGNEPITKGAMAISFDGTVKNKETDSLAFALNISGDSKGVSISELSQGIDPTDLTITEDDFNSLTAAVSFNAKLYSQADAAKVKLMTTREGLMATRTSLDLMFGPYNMRFNTVIKRASEQLANMVITNQDLLTMNLSQSVAGGDITGTIKAPGGGKVLADIATTDLGLKVTIKSDGEILFLNDAK